MPAEFIASFVMSDSTLDRHSERVLLDGIDTANFKNSPVAYYNHFRSNGWRDAKSKEITPFGIWENLRKINGQLIGDLYADMDDEWGRKIASKIRNGILRACSIGLRVIEYSDDPIYHLPGQKGWTVTKSELREASVVDMPANTNALVLSETITSKGFKSGDTITEEVVMTKNFGVIADTITKLGTKSEPSHKKTEEAMSFTDKAKNFLKSVFGKNIESVEEMNQALEGFDMKSITPEGYTELKATVAKQAANYQSLSEKLLGMQQQLEQYKNLSERFTEMSTKLSDHHLSIEGLNKLTGKVSELETANTQLSESNTVLKGTIAEMKGAKNLRSNSNLPKLNDEEIQHYHYGPVIIIEDE